MVDTELGLGLQTPESDSIKSLLSSIDTDDVDSFKGAFAYATQGGIHQLESGLTESIDATNTEWLVSIDYGYTEPEAIRRLDNMGDVRIVGAEALRERNTLNANPRFHPKFVWIQNDAGHNLMMGSANLTDSALTRNWESVVFLTGINDTHRAVDQIASWWDNVWSESAPVTDELLDWYEDIRETSSVSPDSPTHEYDDWEDTSHPRSASIVWCNLGFTQGGSRNQMDIPTQFGEFFLQDGDTWELESEYEVTFRYEDEEMKKKVKYHKGSSQTRIYLPTETNGTRLADLYSSDKTDEDSLRYYFAVFRRVDKYEYSLRILPPDAESDIEQIIETSQDRGQVEETDEETNRLVGWV